MTFNSFHMIGYIIVFIGLVLFILKYRELVIEKNPNNYIKKILTILLFVLICSQLEAIVNVYVSVSSFVFNIIIISIALVLGIYLKVNERKNAVQCEEP